MDKQPKPWHRTKYVHVGQYVAAVEVSLLRDETAWSPYMSLPDAYKLDDVREALQRGDLVAAGKHGRVYKLHPLPNQTDPTTAKTA